MYHQSLSLDLRISISSNAEYPTTHTRKMTTPMNSQPNVLLPSLVGATEPVADPAMEGQARRREKAKASIGADSRDP